MTLILEAISSRHLISESFYENTLDSIFIFNTFSHPIKTFNQNTTPTQYFELTLNKLKYINNNINQKFVLVNTHSLQFPIMASVSSSTLYPSSTLVYPFSTKCWILFCQRLFFHFSPPSLCLQPSSVQLLRPQR